MYEYLISTDNLVFTIPLILGLFISIFSAISLIAIDLNSDFHSSDSDFGLSKEFASSDFSYGEFLDSVLELVGFGSIPFAIWLNLELLCFGLIGITIHFYFLSLILAICLAFIFSLIIVGQISRIMAPYYKDFGIPENKFSFIGKFAIASTSILSNFGEIQIKDENGKSFRLTAVNIEEGKIEKGEKVIILDVKPDNEVYLVKKITED